MRRDEIKGIPGVASHLFARGSRRSRTKAATAFQPRLSRLEDRTLLNSRGLMDMTVSVLPTNPVYGQTVELDANFTTVSPPDDRFSNVPSGSVTFTEGATTYGTVDIVASPSDTGIAGDTGKATLLVPNAVYTSFLSTASHTITATFSDTTASWNITPGHNPRTVTFTVSPALTTTAVSVDSANPVYGQSVNFSAHVAVVSPGGGTPTGSVKFFDNAILIGSGTLDASGTATFATTSLAVGAHATITAAYQGDGNYATSSGSLTGGVTVAADATSTAVTTASSTVDPGQSVSFTATVTQASPGTITPSGSVQFSIDGNAFGSPVALSGGQAVSQSTSSLAVGTHTVTAAFTPSSGNFLSSNGSLTNGLTVSKFSTSITVFAPSPVGYGDPIDLTATVHTANSSVPTGTVVFFANGQRLASASLVPTVTFVGGVATLHWVANAVGPQSITASYLGNDTLLASDSSATTVTVSPAPLNVALVSSTAGPTVYGVPITFTATVTNADHDSQAAPNQAVTFYAGGPGGTRLGSANLVGGVATRMTAILPVGTNSITAVTGSGNFVATTSAAVTQVVTPAPLNVALVSSTAGPTVYGVPITFTATVTNADHDSQAAPDQAVTFYAGGPGGTRLGSANLVGGVATRMTAILPVGTNSITAVTGSGNFAAATSAAVTQVVTPAPLNVALVSSTAGPTVYGVPITFTATVTNADHDSQAAPDQAVTFYAGGPGGTRLGSANLVGGVATRMTAILPVGTNSITAVTGSGNFVATTSAAVTQVVTPAPLNVALVSSTAGPTVYGVPITFTATVTNADHDSQAAPDQAVTFYAGGPGGTRLGSANLVGGVATRMTAILPVGTNSITAVTGSGNFVATTSAAVTQVVNLADTSLALTSSLPDGASAGTPVIFTAMVSNNASASDTPTGSVQFFDGSTLLGTVGLSGGKATLTTSSLTLGSRAIRAVYLVNSKYSSSSNVLTQDIS